MAENGNIDLQKLQEGVDDKVLDAEIIKEVRSDISLLTEIQHRILVKKLHNQLMGMATDAIESGRVQVNSVEDIIALLELELLLS
jgi:hypothetical protein